MLCLWTCLSTKTVVLSIDIQGNLCSRSQALDYDSEVVSDTALADLTTLEKLIIIMQIRSKRHVTHTNDDALFFNETFFPDICG